MIINFGILFENMNEDLKIYLWNEFKFNVAPKYRNTTKYFDEWIKNLTENQILYFNSYKNGEKTPYQN